jgi:hypothetical protein
MGNWGNVDVRFSWLDVRGEVWIFITNALVLEILNKPLQNIKYEVNFEKLKKPSKISSRKKKYLAFPSAFEEITVFSISVYLPCEAQEVSLELAKLPDEKSEAVLKSFIYNA